MARTKMAVVLLLMVVASVSATGAELRATFIGHAGVHITDGRVAILIDFPYDAGDQFMRWSTEHVPKGPPTPLCLITHSHRDHFARELASQFCGQLLGPKDVVEGAGVSSIAVSQEVKWQGVVIHPILTPHADLEHYSYLLEWQGLRLFLTGDTNDPAALLAAQHLDAAFVNPSVLRALQQNAVSLDARLIIAYHHNAGDPVPNFQDRLVPKQGESFTIARE